MSSFTNARVSVNNFAPFVNQQQEIINGNRNSGRYALDTSMPPPNFAPSVLLHSEPVLPFSTPPGSQNNLPVGSHNPVLNYNASHLPAASHNILQSSLPSTIPRYESESSQASSVWINNTIPNIYLDNNGTQHTPNNVFSASSPAQNNAVVPIIFQNQSTCQPQMKSPEVHIPIWNNQFTGNNGQSTLNNFPNQNLIVNGLPPPSVQLEHAALPPRNAPPVWNPIAPINQSNVNNQMPFHGASALDSHVGFNSGSANVPFQASQSPQFAVNSSGSQPPVWDCNNSFNNVNFSSSSNFKNTSNYNPSQNSCNKFNFDPHKSDQFNHVKRNNYSPTGQLGNCVVNDNAHKNNWNTSNFHGRNMITGDQRITKSNDFASNRNFIKIDAESFQTGDQNSFNNRNLKSTNYFNARTNNRDNKNNGNFKSFKRRASYDRQNIPQYFPQQSNQNLTDVQIISSSENSKPKSTFREEVFNGEIQPSSVSHDIIIESNSSGASRNWHKDENQTGRNKSWMTDSIKNALQERNKLFLQARETNDPALWKQYNVLKDKINQDISEAKSKPGFFIKKSRAIADNKFQKKEKDLPFSCDVCDRSYATETELKAHNALHVKCHYTGCSFEAHPKIVALHKRMQHDTGYAEVINKLQNDEDIEKWREERRKRFPTAENILKRKAEQAEKEARGELIEEKDFGKFKNQKFDRRTWKENRISRNPRNRRRGRYPYFRRDFEFDSKQSDSEEECHIKCPKFRGMKIGAENTTDSENDMAEEAKDIPILKGNAKETNEIEIFTSTDQQATNDSDDEAPVEIPISKVSLDVSYDDDDDQPADEMPILKDPVNGSNEIEYQSSDKQSTEENVVNSAEEQSQSSLPGIRNATSEADESTLQKQDKKDDDNPRKRKFDGDRPGKRFRDSEPAPRKASLLEMLLDNEIRHERNVIMQCVRYIVRNNFFGIGQDVEKTD